MTQATLTTKGQVTVPKAIREQLHLRAGDRIDFIVNESGEAVIRRVSCEAKEIRGILAHRGSTPITIEQMDEAVSQRFRNP
jgi:AbrB family looped-hinge helix DNA binding protein